MPPSLCDVQPPHAAPRRSYARAAGATPALRRYVAPGSEAGIEGVAAEPRLVKKEKPRSARLLVVHSGSQLGVRADFCFDGIGRLPIPKTLPG